MNWKSTKPPEPQPFEIGYGVRFAYLPHPAEDGKTYWLEKVRVKLYWGPWTKTWRISSWLGK